MAFTYTSADGEVFTLGGTSPIFADEFDLMRYEWELIRANKRVVGTTRTPIEVSVPVSVMTGTDAEGARLFNRLVHAFERDLATKTPGKLMVNGYEMDVYASAAQLLPDEMFGCSEIESSINFAFDRDAWMKAKGILLKPRNEEDNAWLDFAYDFEFDYGSTFRQIFIENPSAGYSNVCITMYGPTSNPAVIIGGNTYAVDVDVLEGGRLVIDGRDKSGIYLYNAYGEKQNVFDKRRRGKRGSGNYVFEKVPPGMNSVEWDGQFLIEINVYDEVGMPPCST